MSLAVKYRPSSFESTLAQGSTIKILQKQLELNKFTNCYLFAGPSGTGKTTIARIFGNLINQNRGQLIEIDGASNNGVEAVRDIIDSASQRAVDSEYKIFIIDECFDGDTLIKVKDGYKKIKNIKVGEEVGTLTGFSKVAHVFENWVENSTLNYVNLSNGQKILCTQNHLFLTTEGWIEAKDLKEGDELIVYDNLSKLWEDYTHEKKRTEILLQQMPSRLEKEEFRTKAADISCLSNLWKNICSESSMYSYANMFEGMSSKINIAVRKDSKELRIWDGYKEIIIRKNAQKQSNEKSKQHRKNETYESPSWDTPSTIQSAWRKWSLYETTAEVVLRFAEFMNFRINDKNELLRIQSEPLSFSVQSRPWVRKEENSDRGGWCFPSLEKWYCKRYKENQMSDRIRVNGVEVYKQTNRQQSRGSHSGYTKVYDLSIEGHPSYIVNDVVAHNCHMITTAGWNAFLKCIEEPPKYTIFMFCTTNPEKIPDTIKNRVMRFNLSKVNTDLIKQRLAFICSREGYANYVEACDYIAKLSNGGVRDAISLLEKAANYNTDLNINNVLECLGNFSYDSFFNFTGQLLNGDEAAVLQTLNNYYDSGNDLKLFIESYLEFALDLTKYCLFKSMDVVKIPVSLQSRCDGFSSIPNILEWSNDLVEKVLKIKNAIKYDVNAKTTIEVMFISICRGM